MYPANDEVNLTKHWQMFYLLPTQYSFTFMCFGISKDEALLITLTTPTTAHYNLAEEFITAGLGEFIAMDV